MADGLRPDIVESTAGDVAAELARRGIPPGQRVVVTIEPDDWLARIRAVARPLVRAEGLSDDDLDRLIDEARAEVEHRAR